MFTAFHVWSLAAVAIVSVLIGFWTGRSVRWGREEQEEDVMAFAGAEAAREAQAGAVRECFGQNVDRFMTMAKTAFEKETGNEEGGAENSREWKTGRNQDNSINRRISRFAGYARDINSGQGQESDMDRTAKYRVQKERHSESRLPESGREVFNREIAWKEIGMESKRIPMGWAIGSPAAGEVSFFYENARRGAVIRPEQGRLYAPAAGKIVRLYPTGNAFRLRTDFGVELLIQAGVLTEELEGQYFRSRIVQNEIVNKGKLLLEFDLEGIEKEGYDSSILLSVEEAQDYRDINITDVQRVKTGEDLLWVRK